MPEAKKPRYDEKCQSSDAAFHRVLTEFSKVQEKLEQVCRFLAVFREKEMTHGITQLTVRMSEEGLHVVRQVCQQFNALREPHYASRATLLMNLPKFWTTVLSNHPFLSPRLTTDDLEILQYLTNVQILCFVQMEQRSGCDDVRLLFGNTRTVNADSGSNSISMRIRSLKKSISLRELPSTTKAT